MKAILNIACAGILVLVASCASSKNLAPNPPTAAMRADYGNMALVVWSESQGMSSESPDSRGKGMLYTATQTALTPAVLFVSSGGTQSSGDGFIIAVCVAWMPVGFIGGGIFGALKYDSEDTLATNAAAISRVVTETCFDKLLAEQLAAIAARNGRKIQLIPTLEIPQPVQPVASGQKLERDYGCLRAKGVDTVIDVQVITPCLRGREGLDPSLKFMTDVCVRLVSLKDGHLLYRDYIEFQSDSRAFSAWGNNGAQALRTEIERAATGISNEIDSQIFTREFAVEMPEANLLHR